MAANLITLRQLSTALGIVAVSLLCTAGSTAMAAAPRVSIDIGPIVECRDVTSSEFALAHPLDKLVEATVHLSVLLEVGRAEELEQLRLRVDSPEHRLRVSDFQPRTLMASELAGDVEVCATNEKTQSLNASVGGIVAGEHGPVHAQASPAAGVGVTQNHGTKESFHRLAPKQVVLASGTFDAEHGVFFKWNRTSQVSLEGAREVTCRFLVHHQWRGDWIKVNCEATSRHRNYLGEKVETCGRTELYVALYLAGDMPAREAATALATTQLPAATRTRPAVPSATSFDWLNLGSILRGPKHPGGAARKDAAPPADEEHGDVPAALASLAGLAGRVP